MTSTMPTREQFHQFKHHDHPGRIVMVNLVKLKPGDRGRAFAKYESAVVTFIEQLGGRMLYAGQCVMPVIGGDHWDRVLLVEYPSIAAFIEMQKNEAYQAILPWRIDALADARLYFTVPDD